MKCPKCGSDKTRLTMCSESVRIHTQSWSCQVCCHLWEIKHLWKIKHTIQITERGEDAPAICCDCGNEMDLVRPGKWQCVTCEEAEECDGS
jgi:hypothetical protein